MPLEKGAITDDTRIRASLPTLEHLLRAGARLVLASHLGRPKKGPAPDLSLKPVAERLAQLVAAHRGVIEVEHDALVEQRRRQSDEVRALTSGLDAARSSRHASERALEESRAKAHRAEVEEAEAKLRLENAIETLRRDLDVEPEVAEAAEQPELPEGATAAGRVRELDRELRLLGPINPLALEEFNELQQRHAFLEQQLEDVRTTRRDLALLFTDLPPVTGRTDAHRRGWWLLVPVVVLGLFALHELLEPSVWIMTGAGAAATVAVLAVRARTGRPRPAEPSWSVR